MNWDNQEPKKMSWELAQKLESSSRRLPHIEELEEAFKNKVEGFDKDSYWSRDSKEDDPYNNWMFDFATGRRYYLVKSYYCRVRLINKNIGFGSFDN